MLYLILSHNYEELKKSFCLDAILKGEEFQNSWDKILEEDLHRRIGISSPSDDFLEYLLEKNYPLVMIDGDKDFLPREYSFDILPPTFFQRDAKKVAIELLGKLLVRKLREGYIVGKIVETEAYYGPDDPASRAYKGKKDYNKGMWLNGGHIFIYMVHANWMLNITTDKQDAQAVLIRAVEPIAGIHLMRKNRRRKNLKDLCSGPGKLSQSFYITRDMNEKLLGSELLISSSPWKNFEIGKSHRIGVKHDLDEPLRFFIKDSLYISRNKLR
ncbi:3-methyladenine DNA glycosylase [Euryarchaeota archaeon ex4484_178]|nr:MAG: 3-methyladenine DNA glycosylase [Euryarchaeota archaeon ex4484_178]